MTSPALPHDHDHRRQITEQLDKTLLVEAAAGTGKTTGMVDRMVSLLRNDQCRIETLSAVTFTRASAAELRSRFHSQLERAVRTAKGKEKQFLAQGSEHVDRCFIGTIHAFCARILRERPIEAEVDLAFRELEPSEDLQMRQDAWSEYVADLFEKRSPLLEELPPLGLEIGQLREAFTQFADFPDVDNWPAEKVTFDLSDIQHSIGQVQNYIQHMRELTPFPEERGTDKLMDTFERLIRLERLRDLDQIPEFMDLVNQFKPTTHCTQKYWPDGQGRQERDRWKEFCDQVAGPLQTRWREMRYSAVMRILKQAVATYDRVRSDNAVLNYQDLLMKTAALLRNNPSIRQYFRRRITHLLVDEFQDTDPVQAEIMMYLTADDYSEQDWRKCRPVPGSLFVVGDPKQSIYRFRRADIVTYNKVKEIICDSGGVTVPLTTNFRTVSPLVDWINSVFKSTFPVESDTYSPASVSMHTGRQQVHEGTLGGIQTLDIPEKIKPKERVAYEASFIARFIRNAIDSGQTVPRSSKELEAGIPSTALPSDFMIVTWEKKHLFDYAQALQKLKIPHSVTGASALSQVHELSLLLTCLKSLAEPENPVLLVAVIRGPLFGIPDDQLYAYKLAGGRFSFHATIPENLPSKVASSLQNAFSKLKQHSLWLSRLPLVSAIERIAYDLGLPMLALSRPGGHIQSGSMLKAFELLRSMQSDFHSLEDLTIALETLIDRQTEVDGIPVRPYDKPGVRVMNLHKVKGLQAPVVFLAGSTPLKEHPVKIHVDRSGNRVNGYLTISESLGKNRHASTLAQPVNWHTLEKEERRFEQAEKNRLLYVAATRAGTQVVVTQRLTSRPSSQPPAWDFFSPHLDTSPSLHEVAPPPLQSSETVEVASEDIQLARKAISNRWETSSKPSYSTVASKELTMRDSKRPRTSGNGEHGTEWGTLIHLLLESAMRQPEADLTAFARNNLEQLGLSTTLTSKATATVSRVMEAAFWKRAQASDTCFVEIPFQHQLSPKPTDSDTPTLVRGVIDLVFREQAGWVVVDYKTDTVQEGDQEQLADYYRNQVEQYATIWEQMVGAAVCEKALFLTTTGQYVIL